MGCGRAARPPHALEDELLSLRRDGLARLRVAPRQQSRRSRLLFVAHREEILDQSLATFRYALRDATFGEKWVGGSRPSRFDHVFASETKRFRMNPGGTALSGFVMRTSAVRFRPRAPSALVRGVLPGGRPIAWPVHPMTWPMAVAPSVLNGG